MFKLGVFFGKSRQSGSLSLFGGSATRSDLVMASLPNSQRLYGGGPYSAVWTTGGSNDRPVQLTVLGLHHSKRLHRDPRYPPIEEAFFLTLRHLVAAYQTVEPSPFEVMTVEVEVDDATTPAQL